MTRRTPQAVERQVAQYLDQRIPQRKIAEELGISKTAVASIAARRTPAKPTGPSRQERRAAEHAAKPTAPVASARLDRRADLLAVRDAATTPTTYYEACWALLCHDEPKLDAYLATGSTRLDALSSVGLDEMLLLHRPEDIAELAVFVTDDVSQWGRDEDAGESEEQYTVWQAEQRAASHARAVALLEAALVIVQSEVPV